MDLSARCTLSASEVLGLAVVSCLLLAASAAHPYTIVVPADHPTIQQGIDASVEGDTVLVMPGTYVENILIDRDVVVRSADGPAVTIIDGSQPSHPDSGRVVKFFSESTFLSNSSIEGFDIRGGSGGIHVDTEAPGLPPAPGPLIFNNWIHGNWLEEGIGAGIVAQGTARIVSNRIFDNGFDGATVWIAGAAFAGGSRTGEEPLLLQDNEIYDNHVLGPTPPGSQPEATVTVTTGNLSGNILACNSGYGPSALSVWHIGIVEMNTIVANFSISAAPAVRIGSSTSCNNLDILFLGNNVTDNHGPGLECIDCTGDPIYLLECNNFAANMPGGQVIGTCADVIGQDGNISVDPIYGRVGCEPGYDYWCLSANSPLLIDPPPGCGLIGALGLCPPIGIRDTEPVAPRHLRVSAPRPNPFTNRTTIPFYLAKDSEVEVQIYNVLGRKLRTLHTDWLLVGDHVLEWDGRIESGDRAASGAYVARIRAGGEELTRTLLLIR